jgi:Calcineurin-like phosphoesterase
MAPLLASIVLAGVVVTTASAAIPIRIPVRTLATDPVLVGAGDIADCTTTKDSATANLLDGIGGTVFTLGDNTYTVGSPKQFQDCYGPTWGRAAIKARTKPTAGNHDYLTAAAAGYYGYFGAAAGDPKKGYYSYDLGSWHIVVLNSNCAAVGGCQATSPQGGWLRANLAANMDKDVLAYWHHPRFSSGQHGDSTAMQAFWEILYAAGADVVLNGHDHDYERFARQDPWGRSDARYGIREFVVGTGGTALRPRASTAANSQVFSTTYGVLRLTLRPGAYDWSFEPIADSTFRDRGTTPTHGPPPRWTTATFPVTSDTYVDQGHPSTTYGGATRLRVDADTGSGLDRHAYIKVTASGLSGTVDRAALRLWVTNGTRDGPRVYPTTTSWSGGSMTWRNRPRATGPPASDAGAIMTGAWVELDVTSIVHGNGTFGFLVSPTSGDGLDVDSLQGGHPPRLIVQTGAPGA